jgi:hypothetical protein
MGQSRKTMLLCSSTDRTMRVMVRAKSYRVQLRGAPNRIKAQFAARHGHGLPETVMWHDIQIIPRTHQREDRYCEVHSAESAMRRRNLELHEWQDRLGENVVQDAIDGVVSGGCKVGHDTWARICAAIDRRFRGTESARPSDWTPGYFHQSLSRVSRGPATSRWPYHKINTGPAWIDTAWPDEVKINDPQVAAVANEIKNEIDKQIAHTILYGEPLLAGWDLAGQNEDTKHGTELGRRKEGGPAQHSSWERFANPQRFGLRQEHHADGRIRDAAFAERKA